MHVRAGALGHEHVLGDLLAHGGHGHELAGGYSADGLERHDDRRRRRSFVARCRWGGRWRSSGGGCSGGVLGDEGLDVFLSDASTQACAWNLGEIDVILFGDLADKRAGTDSALLARIGVAIGLRLRRGGQGGRLLGLFAGWRLSSLALSSHWSGLFRRSGLCGRWSRGGIAVSDDADDGVHLDGGTGLDLDLLQRAGRRSRDFSVNLVGGDFKQRLVALDLVAGLFEPFGDGSFEDRFAHLGHDDVSWH